MRAKQPNILWICTDQQRYDTIGALGFPGVMTPHIDRLVHEGLAFERAYCQSPICTPSRASFLTGAYPSVSHNNRNGNDRFVERFPLVTRTLADAGYDCGLIGKLHLAGAHRRMEPRTDGTFATMYLDTRYKLVVYHGHNLGELYDLKNDPGEFDNLWNDPDFSEIKMDMLLRSFDKSMLIMDRGTPRIGPM